MASRGGGGGVVGSAAMLGLDMHLAPQQMHLTAFQPDHHHNVGGFQLQQPAPVRQQQPPSFSPYSNSSSRVVTASHDEEMAGNGKVGAVQQQQGPCPWTRMKWTDAMVRLLIRVVYSVGDDGEGLTGGKAAGAHGKVAGSSSGHGHASSQQQQQKKGKWKSVSRAMMDNGFLVSPQQCEDKFNDLNKRYKRVVDLLGRGRACRVVENPALLDAIDDLTPKDEARKLLSSKHLFFQEMCAYHNSGAPHVAGAVPSLLPPNQDAAAACLHHPPPAPMTAASSAARQGHGRAPSPPGTKDSSADDDSVSNNEDDYDEEDDGHMYPTNHNQRRHHFHRGGKRGRGTDDSAAGEDFGDDDGKRGHTAPAAGEASAAMQQLQSELASAAAGDPQAAKGWVRRRAVEVEEQQVALDRRAHQLERQRLKWERFRANKERDMERARLRNDLLRLDAQRMLLMLRHRDLELDMAEANSSSVDHHPGQGILAAHMESSPSTAAHPN
jgi:hypothetical protein